MRCPKASLSLVLTAFLAISGLSTHLSCSPGTQKSAPTIALTSCFVAGPRSLERIPARCGVLELPEDRSKLDGNSVPLHFAVLEATSGKSLPDPVVMLAGGPGQSGLTAYPPLMILLERLRRDRDIVLVDVRGTGRSNPLMCPEEEDPFLPSDPEKSRQKIQECLKTLEGDPRFYATHQAVEDVEALRKALGYPQVNVMGQSYGSRAALVYLRQYPDAVRSLVLSAVAPPHQTHFQHSARDAQQSLDRTFQRCAEEPACNKAFPDLKGDVEKLLTRLEAGAVPVTVTHPVTGEDQAISLDRSHLVGLLFKFSYSAITLAMLPVLVHNAAETGDLRPLAAQLLISDPGMEDFATGLHVAVTCSEDRRLLDVDAARADAAGTYWGTLGLNEFVARCEGWPQGDVPKNAFEPVTSSVPVLLISGELDPVTPPESAEAAAKTLSNARHLVVKHASHDAFMMGCVPRLATDFIQKGSAEGLDVSCLEQRPPLPFFLTRLGPRP